MTAHAHLLAGLVLAASISLSAQGPIPPRPVETNLTIEATQNKVDAGLRVKDLLVHGGKESGVDALQAGVVPGVISVTDHLKIVP
jgi:hypothetical protein